MGVLGEEIEFDLLSSTVEIISKIIHGVIELFTRGFRELFAANCPYVALAVHKSYRHLFPDLKRLFILV